MSGERYSGRGRLTNPPSRLLGRENDLATIRSLLLTEQVRLLTLAGPGGVGKTRLALAAGEGVSKDFALGAVFVDLAPVLDPANVLICSSTRPRRVH